MRLNLFLHKSETTWHVKHKLLYCFHLMATTEAGCLLRTVSDNWSGKWLFATNC